MTGRGRAIVVGTLTAVALGAAVFGLTLARQAVGEEERKGQAMTTTYEIGVTEGRNFVPLATLSFDAAHTGTLVLGAPNPRTRQLVQVWADLAGRDKLRVEKTVHLDGADGQSSVGLMSVEVAKSDPAFPDAVLRYLAHEYGFDSRP